MISRRKFLAHSSSAAALSFAATGQPFRPTALTLWYAAPAAKWTDALPLGNGRLGAMVFGGLARERLQLNEDTLWSGHPKDWNNPDAREHLKEVRRLVLEEENYVEADKVCRKMQGPYNQSYLTLGNLLIAFDSHDTSATPLAGYTRDLDLSSAISTVRYSLNGDSYLRESFVSAPDQVIALRLTATRAQSFTISLDCPIHSQVDSPAAAHTLRLFGKAPSHVDPNYLRSDNPVFYDDAEGKGMRFETRLRVRAPGAAIRVASGTSLRVEGAKHATILIAAATGFRGFDRLPDRSAEEISRDCEARLTAAARRSWTDLRTRHIADHRKLFGRVTLDLGGNSDAHARPTDERLKSIKDTPDPALIALYFQYGRYLLIASSRPGTQPANLQGIWNELVRPPWSSNWTANINTQMNYWPAETCHLAECHEPLFDLAAHVSVNGSKTAQVNYGARGWVSHHNIDIWAQSAPVGKFGLGGPTWANWSMSGPWLCAHLWERYQFSRDAAFLRQRAYPVMRSCAEFCLDWLIEDRQKRLTTCPSFSTENTFLDAQGKRAEVSDGCTMDMALISELFTNCESAAQALGIDAPFAAKLKQARARLIPYQVGKHGQLQEWSKDFTEREPDHRHMSHMYGLYPGSDITPARNAVMAKAARVSLERRLAAGGAYTGWSRAWAIGFWARLLDGARAHESIVMLLLHSTGPNLFDTHPAGSGWIFQIDGNFGAAAAIAEMLIQSQDGGIQLLPALPADAWPNGKVTGLRARGNVEVDVEWAGGLAKSVTLRPASAGEIRVSAPKGQRITAIQGIAPTPAPDSDGWTVIKSQPGRRYVLSFAAAKA